jgi:predicted dehydrogenase
MLHRRNFIKYCFGTAVVGSALSATSYSKVQGANDAIRLAIIGCGSKVLIGGQGRKDMRTCRKIPGVRIAALCDVDSVNLGYAVEDCSQNNEKPETFHDVRKLLEREDIDAVWVTTPNHWHALVCIWAAQAGKHFFVQKPVSHSIFEGRQMVEAARKYDRIGCSTTNTRSLNGFTEAIEFAKSGHLGKPLYIHALRFGARNSIGKVTEPTPIPASIDYNLWSGPALIKPIQRKNLHYDWHWDWDYGNGELGNWGIHLLDGAREATGSGIMPKHVLSVGGRFGYDDDGQTPNTQIIYWDYEPLPILYEMRGLPSNKSQWKNAAWNDTGMDKFHGKAFTTSIQCENGYTIDNIAYDNDGKEIRKFTGTLKSAYHAFFNAIREGNPDPHYDIAEAHTSAGLVHLGNISHRLGQSASPEQIRERLGNNTDFLKMWEQMLTHLKANEIDLKKTSPTLGAFLTFDPQTEKFTGEFAEEADKFLKREYRKEFTVPKFL